jgi:hypothetical protein
MSHEHQFRRPEFRAGMLIPLADGQPWVFPLPGGDVEPADGGAVDDPEVRALLEVIRDAEDRADRHRAELALAIHLLGCNYALTPDQRRRVLEFGPGDPGEEEARRAFRVLAVRVAERVAPRAAEPSAGRPSMAGILARLAGRAPRHRRGVGLAGLMGGEQ